VDPRTLRNRILFSVLFGVIVFAGLTFYADFRALGEVLSEFRWELMPLILALTTSNYVFRFVKWEYYLNLIGVRGLPKRDSLLIFFSGLGMVITPAKAGEWIKSYFLREIHGTPFARSAPILIGERLTDSLALLLMASVGVFYFDQLWQVFAVVLAGAVVIIVIARHRPTAMALIRLGGQVPVLRRFVPQIHEFYESTYIMMAPKPLILMTALSTFSWFFEVLGYYVTLIGLGLDPGGELLLQAAFILPIATLASAILLTPGGLGVAEAGIQTLSQTLLDLPKSAAAVGTLIIRFTTLWFGVFIGLAAFAVLSRRLSKQAERPAVPPEEALAAPRTLPDAPP
jgi:uncharacterized protein (TIRG00374 family)